MTKSTDEKTYILQGITNGGSAWVDIVTGVTGEQKENHDPRAMMKNCDPVTMADGVFLPHLFVALRFKEETE